MLDEMDSDPVISDESADDGGFLETMLLVVYVFGRGSQSRSYGIDTCLEFSRRDYFANYQRFVHSSHTPLSS